MFGYITVSPKHLDPAQRRAYQGAYCGLCRRLQESYGQRARLFLSFDMTFLGLLLSALWEPESDRWSAHRCPFHPFRSLPRRENACLDYGADMTLLLQYYQAMDHWQDEGKRGARRRAEWIAPFLPRLEQTYPRQSGEVRAYVAALGALEAENCQDPDRAANLTGEMLAEIFDWQGDLWSGELRRIGFYLGKFIYFMDAWEDLERDRKKAQYNPLFAWEAAGALAPRCQEVLTDLLAQAALTFERLPILQEDPSAAVLREALYAGAWRRFDQVRAGREKGRTGNFQESKETEHGPL